MEKFNLMRYMLKLLIFGVALAVLLSPACKELINKIKISVIHNTPIYKLSDEMRHELNEHMDSFKEVMNTIDHKHLYSSEILNDISKIEEQAAKLMVAIEKAEEIVKYYDSFTERLLSKLRQRKDILAIYGDEAAIKQEIEPWAILSKRTFNLYIETLKNDVSMLSFYAKNHGQYQFEKTNKIVFYDNDTLKQFSEADSRLRESKRRRNNALKELKELESAMLKKAGMDHSLEQIQ